jgi:Na+/phosphate symporter
MNFNGKKLEKIIEKCQAFVPKRYMGLMCLTQCLTQGKNYRKIIEKKTKSIKEERRRRHTRAYRRREGDEDRREEKEINIDVYTYNEEEEEEEEEKSLSLVK